MRDRQPVVSGITWTAAACVFGCGSLSGSDSVFWEPARDLGGIPIGSGGRPADAAVAIGVGSSSGTGGSSSGGAPPSGGRPVSDASGGAPPPAGECALSFSATTVSAKGRYSPRNVGAVWIETNDGRFIKTLRTWGGPVRLPNATAWRSVSGQNVVDVVSSATRAGHGPIEATWNCTDTSRQLVSPGAYRLAITFAEDNAVAAVPPPLYVARIPFDTGVRPDRAVAADLPNFTAMTIDLR